jgi:hypothetical protein
VSLGIVTSPIGIFFVLVGVFIDAPFMKEILDEIEYLRKNRRIMGMAIALFGFVLIALS